MSSILMVRHGQASFGRDTYDELYDVGRYQAEAIGRWLKERSVGIDAALCGPRQRQRKTADIILCSAGIGDVSPVVLTALDEFGEGEEILKAAERAFGIPLFGPRAPDHRRVLELYSEAYRAWSQGILDIPGRQSFSEFRKRVKDWLSAYTSRLNVSGHKCVVVTSAGVISAVVCETLGLDDPFWSSLTAVIENASLTEVLYSRGKIGLRIFNSTGHLPVELTSRI